MKSSVISPEEQIFSPVFSQNVSALAGKKNVEDKFAILRN